MNFVHMATLIAGVIGIKDYKCVITNLLTCPVMSEQYWQTLWDWFVILFREPVKTFSMLSSITFGIYGFLLALENEVPEVTFPIMLEISDYLWTEASACNFLLHLIITLLKKCRMRMEKRKWLQSIKNLMKHYVWKLQEILHFRLEKKFFTGNRT